MSEKDLMNPLLLRASKAGHRWFRQNVGVGWVGKLLRKTEETVTLGNARPLHAGLCVGSGDIIGWTRREITPEMVGQTVAVFTSVEIKRGRTATTKEQTAFCEAVLAAGGIAGIVRSVEEGEALFHQGGGA